jgi:hypothetical protein
MRILEAIVSFVPALRSTRVLDDRKVGRVAREEAVVHALLRNRAAAPMHAAPEGLRRAVAQRIEKTQPLPMRAAWSVSPKLLAAVAPVVLLAIGGSLLLHTRSQSTPTTLQPVVQRPFMPIVAVGADESGVTGFPAGTVDEGLLTAGPLVTPRRGTPAWMRELPNAPAQTSWASDKAKADPLLMEARAFEFTGRATAQVLIVNQLKNQGKREE